MRIWTWAVIAVMINAIIFSGCEIRKFVMPTWEVDLNLPLVNQKHYVSELIDSVHFIYADDYNIIFQTMGDLESFDVGNIPVEMSDEIFSLPLFTGMNQNGSLPIIDENIEICFGILAQGSINYNFNNVSGSMPSMLITFPDITDSTGAALTFTYSESENWNTKDLTGYRIGYANSNDIIHRLRYNLQVNSAEPEGTPLGICRLQISPNLSLSFLRGKISYFRLNLRDCQSVIDIDYPNGIDQAIELTETCITMNILNPFSFTCKLYGEFYAINETTGNNTFINLFYEPINPSVDSLPVETHFTYNSEVNNLLSVMPTHIELRNAYFLIENEPEIGEINSSDVITGDYRADVPFNFIIHDALITPGDSVEIKISQENADLIRKNARSADLRLRVLNNLPIGAETTLYFSTDHNIDVSDPLTYDLSKSVYIHAATQPNVEQHIQINMDADEIKLFANRLVFMKTAFHFDATDGPVIITASPADYIRIKCMMKVSTYISE